MFEDWREDLDAGTSGHTTDGVYDVGMAKAILKKNPRESVNVELCQFEDLAKKIAGYSTSGVRLDVPIILIPVGEGHEPIDGWSRIIKATQEGRSSLPAVFLTAGEKEQIRLA
jgi:hypothetical protein